MFFIDNKRIYCEWKNPRIPFILCAYFDSIEQFNKRMNELMDDITILKIELR